MEFKVLSHAGLLVKNNAGKTLICDPWLIGSCYWRSWWNYPPVSKTLVDSLVPDYIYLTHIHWDHFHGPSLEKFTKNTPIIVPKGNYTRMKEDLNYLGFTNVIELKHGEAFIIDKDFSIYSYQFWMFLDSAVLINCDGVNLLNLNDSKHMGPTLQQIVRKHQPIDFVFRSHSSANERLSYEIVDDTNAQTDDLETYIKDFALTVRATGAKYAIPFASNHCHLHKDSIHFNQYIQHPKAVAEYFANNSIDSPSVQVMVSGDSWSQYHGFSLTTKDWFRDREQHIAEYLQENKEKLLAFYEEEDKAEIKKEMVVAYFQELIRQLPFFVRRYFKGKLFTYVLKVKDRPAYVFQVNINTGFVESLDPAIQLDHDLYPLQIHTTAFIFLRGMEYRIFSHMCIGKRVFYKVKKADKKYMEALNLIYNFYDYHMLPLRRNFTGRSLSSWLSRWRELALYLMFCRDMLLYNEIRFEKYLKPVHTKHHSALNKPQKPMVLHAVEVKDKVKVH
jgi:UDP-MurNAc hydroxylase